MRHLDLSDHNKIEWINQIELDKSDCGDRWYQPFNDSCAKASTSCHRGSTCLFFLNRAEKTSCHGGWWCDYVIMWWWETGMLFSRLHIRRSDNFEDTRRAREHICSLKKWVKTFKIGYGHAWYLQNCPNLTLERVPHAKINTAGEKNSSSMLPTLTSGETLCRNNRRLIGTPLIVINDNSKVISA